ncbi:MAG: 3-methyl-2-oxobutanoate hydroxymethyltransferase [Candidatus Melainabacteria bacterium RIFOXYA12_FULL_32_12]|nr:MAG: 3-methyl-2-oxobutanoate hydroxymethyltransferase [Candidatus Melainabacteria bacterium RIFOXYA2_FULL_32_9]OGI29372.1 MAG: 3-methyl-2-oxobutanoate hydroxymethyltransferase [Candidatus Melainabacteria bacterium RIFOXYA12_FULL_32_12]
MQKTITTGTLQKYKREGRKITALTAYDYSTAKFLDEAGIDIILVGDSLAMVALGHKTTHAITVDEMIHHTKAVTKGVDKSFVAADMPFMSYQVDENTAVHNAGRFIKEAEANAVKLEGGSDHIINIVKRCVEAGIPVMGHLGFTPQYLHTLSGYKVQGKNLEATKKILEQAKKLEEVGAFSIVLEMVPEESAKLITDNLNIPTIGIGAGRFCSGQILVTDDILGKYSDFTPKFARKYLDLASLTKKAFSEYKEDVISGKFPAESEIFKLTVEEKERLKDVGDKII